MDHTLLLFQVVLYGNPHISGIARRTDLLGGGCVHCTMPERPSSPLFAWCVSAYAVRSTVFTTSADLSIGQSFHTTRKVSINDKSAKTY
jgi:hypothetical protein